jgi:hypothetical protein
MSHSLRWAVCAALLVLGFVGACLTFSIPWDGPESPDPLTTLFEEFDRADNLRLRLDASHARLHAQDLIAHALIAGKIDLAEAVRLFDALPDRPDASRELLRLEFPAATDRELLGHLVIRWTLVLLRHDPDRAEALRRRWLADLAKFGAQAPP